MGILSNLSWGNIRNLFQDGYNRLSQARNKDTRELAAPRPDFDPTPKGVIKEVVRQFQARVEMELRIWKRAVEQAEYVLRPRRNELYRVYHRAMEDDHLLSQVRTAHFTVQMADFKLERDGVELEDEKELLARPWMLNYIRHCVDAELWGHSLVEFDGRKNEAGEFTRVMLVPRIHVRPEYGLVVVFEHDEDGIEYREEPYSELLMEIGEPDDLGLLKVLSKLAIRKEYALVDWSRRNEKYGMPFLAIKTATRDKTEIDEKAEMAANFGSNSWAIFDDMDEVQMLESSQANTYQSFEKMADRMDRGISILVNGQTGTTEEKSFVGSAEVHERILNTYTKARMLRIQNHINERLIPFLVRHGYPLEGVEFQYLDLLEDAEMTDTMDNQDDPTPPGELSAQKKKLELSSTPYIYGAGCCQDHTTAALALGIDVRKILDRAVRNVHDRKLKAGDLDPKAWAHFSSELSDALREGWGEDLSDISYRRSTDWELAAQLQRNIFVFAAFKNHANIADMAAALVDEQGNLREWEEFKAIAETISQNYYEPWLRAEYQTAVATGQTAAKWAQFQRNKDVLPFLTYVTQQDEKVREAHRVLEGVTKRVDDPYWDTFYPPNGWNCRCDIIQTAGPETTDNFLEPNEEQVPPIFRHNPAKTGELFGNDHPYWKDMPEAQKERLLKATSRLVYENYAESDWQRIEFDQPSGGYLVVSRQHDTARREDNFLIGAILAKQGEPVELLAKTTALDGPDAARAGRLWAFVLVRKLETLTEQLDDAARRARRIVVAVKQKMAAEVQAAVDTWKEGKDVEVEVRVV
jgi:SPP1 gp7 family putative phage head morphogenesis protein